MILDVGASNGDTADFFLRKGAAKVFAVEGNQVLYYQLEENSRRIPNLLPFFIHIRTPEQWKKMITEFRPDIVKADCEGCEEQLFLVEDEVFRLPFEYLLEIHSEEVFKAFLAKFEKTGYTVLKDDLWASPVRIVLARKNIKAPQGEV